MNSLGVVVIGRNEGERLRRCLDSVCRHGIPVVYVDSASTDGSCELACSKDVAIMAVDSSQPLTAARGRNVGFQRLKEIMPDVEFVQFVDGDCEIAPDWLAHAAGALAEQPELAAVRGHLREKNRNASIYRRLCDMEWQGIAKEIKTTGGIVMVRAEAFERAGGFKSTVIAGEESELCQRLRAAGHSIRHLGAEMGVHDSGMTRFGQWWRRAARSGHSFAEGAALDLSSKERRNHDAVRSIIIWGLVLPLVCLTLIWAIGGYGSILLIAYLLLWLRIWRGRRVLGNSVGDSELYATFCIVGKFAQVYGVATYLLSSKRVRNYKSAASDAMTEVAVGPQLRPACTTDRSSWPTIRLAYLNSRYPSLSHTFVEREVREVRAAGIELHTFSIRRPAEHDLLGRAHETAAAETFYLLDGALSLVRALGVAFLQPIALVRTTIEAQRLSPPGLRLRVLHLVYMLEGVRLAREMRFRDLSHVHVHMANNGAAVALLATVFDRRLSYSLSIHGSAEFFQVTMLRLKIKAERAVFVRCISDFCRAQIMAWTDTIHWGRYHIVHCAVDTDQFRPRQPSLEGSLRIITIGRLDAIKGYPQLLAACRELTNLGIDWRLDMVGDGPQRDLLERLVRELALSDYVTFSGAVGQDNLQEHLDRADVMVVSSFMEGVPVVLMEAMAKQLTVIASHVGGIPELVQNGVNGLLVPPGSVEALTKALRRVAEDRSLLIRFAAASRAKIVEEFSQRELGHQMAALFGRYCDKELSHSKRAEPIVAQFAMRGSNEASLRAGSTSSDERAAVFSLDVATKR